MKFTVGKALLPKRTWGESSQDPYRATQRKVSPCLHRKLFTNKALIIGLEKEGIYACGAARKDYRGFPDELKNFKLQER